MKEKASKRPPTVAVTYSDGKQVLVQRFALLSQPGLAEFKELYHQLLFYFVQSNSALGEVLANPAAIGYIKQISEMLPVVGQSKPGIDIENLLAGDDREQICRLFFTESIQDDGEYATDEQGRQKGFIPSSLARLNQLDFFGAIAKAYDQVRMEQTLQQPTNQILETSALVEA